MIKNICGLMLFIISLNVYSQIKSSFDEFGNLQFTGIMDTASESNFELSECISASALIFGIESKTESVENGIDSSFVKGGYSYSYYVDDYESSAGEVKFKFEYIIKNGNISYRFWDFEHEKSGSEFESIGLLPRDWNEKIKETFTKKQYTEIKTDIRLNVSNAIRMITKYCINWSWKKMTK